MDPASLHLFGVAFAKGALHVKPITSIPDPFAIARGDIDVNKELQFVHSSGSTRFDLVGTECPALRLLSHRFIELLRAEHAAGWTSCPVAITGKKGEAIAGYQVLMVTGRCGPIDNSRSAKVLKMPPPGGNPYEAWRGFYFDESTWDGSDLFCPGDTAHVIVTDRIRTAAEREKLTNVSFVRLTEVERLTSELG